MKNARKALKEQGIIDVHLDCTNYKLQNAVKDTMKDTECMKATMEKAKRIMKHIRKSTLANNNLKKACARTGHGYKKLQTR